MEFDHHRITVKLAHLLLTLNVPTLLIRLTEEPNRGELIATTGNWDKWFVKHVGFAAFRSIRINNWLQILRVENVRLEIDDFILDCFEDFYSGINKEARVAYQ